MKKVETLVIEQTSRAPAGQVLPTRKRASRRFSKPAAVKISEEN